MSTSSPASNVSSRTSQEEHSVWSDVKAIASGMKLTLKYFLNPKSVVTREYPENRDTLKLPERSRGQVIMPHDDQGDHLCTGCTLCEKACPNGTISILNTKTVASKRVLGQFIYRYAQCTMCGLCVEACPFDAIRMGWEFEGASTQRSDLELILNKKEGRD
jgi:NADH-quinone oxidoreductase subunit I